MKAVPTLLSVTAADLMSKTVVAIPGDISLQGAAHLLTRAHVSGAPVVDKEGHCIGVISATDFVSWAEKGAQAAKSPSGSPGCVHSAWQVLEIHDLPEDRVSCYMTADPVTVPPWTPIGELSQMMLDAHIHRLIVVDELNRPVGIVSSTDVLAAVARAAAKSAAQLVGG